MAWSTGLIPFIQGLWDYWFLKCHSGIVVRMLEELPENWGCALGGSWGGLWAQEHSSLTWGRGVYLYLRLADG